MAFLALDCTVFGSPGSVKVHVFHATADNDAESHYLWERMYPE